MGKKGRNKQKIINETAIAAVNKTRSGSANPDSLEQLTAGARYVFVDSNSLQYTRAVDILVLGEPVGEDLTGKMKLSGAGNGYHASYISGLNHSDGMRAYMPTTLARRFNTTPDKVFQGIYTHEGQSQLKKIVREAGTEAGDSYAKEFFKNATRPKPKVDEAKPVPSVQDKPHNIQRVFYNNTGSEVLIVSTDKVDGAPLSRKAESRQDGDHWLTYMKEASLASWRIPHLLGIPITKVETGNYSMPNGFSHLRSAFYDRSSLDRLMTGELKERPKLGFFGGFNFRD